MNQHEIEIIANPIDDLLGTPRVARQDHDIAQRTKNERPGTPRPGGFDQPIKLKTKRPAAKRKRFDQQGIRLLVPKGVQERRPTCCSQLIVNRPAYPVHEHLELRVEGPDRRQLDYASGRGACHSGSRLSSRDQSDPDTLSHQRFDNS